MMFDPVSAVKADLAAKAAAKVELARQSLAAHKLPEAAALSTDVLEAFPDDRDARSIHESATTTATRPTRSTKQGKSRRGGSEDSGARAEADNTPLNPKVSAQLFHKAQTAKASGDLGHAAQFARQALKSDPSNGSARALVDELRVEAKERFRAAYGEQETDATDALQKLHQVLSMTAPGDEYYGKALKLIEKLKQ